MGSRAAIYRRWTDARLAGELARALKRSTLIADELNRRAREIEKREHRETARADQETSFMLAHRAEASHG